MDASAAVAKNRERQVNQLLVAVCRSICKRRVAISPVMHQRHRDIPAGSHLPLRIRSFIQREWGQLDKRLTEDVEPRQSLD